MNKLKFTGHVVSGKQLGRTIGFPTANLVVNRTQIDTHGVFAVTVHHAGNQYAGVMNIGVRPSFEDGTHTTVEVHILDFAGDLYGDTLTVETIAFLRPEQAFENLEALVAQLKEDVRQVRKLVEPNYMYARMMTPPVTLALA